MWGLHSSNVGLESLPSQQQVQDIDVQGGDGIPAKFLNPLDSNQFESESYDPSGQNIPIIDVASLLLEDGDSFLSSSQAKEIEQACREWGIFQVVNHGVPTEMIQRVSDLALQYFNSPLEARDMDFASSPQPNSGLRDWNDLMIHFVKPPLPDIIKRRKLPAGYTEAMKDCVDEVLKLSKMLRRVMSSGLGLNSSRIEEAIEEPEAVVRVNYYPPCSRPELVSGLTAHSDISVMTVLHQNEVAGLQVLKDGSWVTVPPTPNALTINVSDILEVMSNGAYVSSEHRCFVNPHSYRLSLGMFITMPALRPFGPLPELLDAEHPPLYKQTNLSDYLDVAKINGYIGKFNLSTLRLPAPAAAPPALAPARAASESTSESALPGFSKETFVFKLPEPSTKNMDPSTAHGSVSIPKLIGVGA